MRLRHTDWKQSAKGAGPQASGAGQKWIPTASLTIGGPDKKTKNPLLVVPARGSAFRYYLKTVP